jgi:SNF2 family DNA or RNA helicase
MLKKNYESQINESKHMCNHMTIISEDYEYVKNESCIICMDKVSKPTMSKDCRHIYCQDCILKWIKNNKYCPTCKRPARESNLVSLMKQEDKPQMLKFIEKYGSKLGTLMGTIKQISEDSESRIIIFSQWDDMLNIISDALTSNGMKNSFVKGTSWMRNSAINNFKDGTDTKIIMLSLKNKASGTNLIEATHIFLLDPVNDSKDQVHAIEMQAISRACRVGQTRQVEIIRILTKNTIEEEIYNNIYLL